MRAGASLPAAQPYVPVLTQPQSGRDRRMCDFTGVNVQPGALIAFLLVPGMALMMGILPFLKEPSTCAVAASVMSEER